MTEPAPRDFIVTFLFDNKDGQKYPDLNTVLINYNSDNKPPCLIGLRQIDVNLQRASVTLSFIQRYHWIEFLAHYRPCCKWLIEVTRQSGKLKSLLIADEYQTAIKLLVESTLNRVVNYDEFDADYINDEPLSPNQIDYRPFPHAYCNFLLSAIRYFEDLDQEITDTLRKKLENLRTAWRKWGKEDEDIPSTPEPKDQFLDHWTHFCNLREGLEPFMNENKS